MTLNHAILQELDQCKGYLLPQATLVASLRLTHVPPPTQAEAESALREIESKRFIVAQRSEIDGTLKWKLTDLGAAALASA